MRLFIVTLIPKSKIGSLNFVLCLLLSGLCLLLSSAAAYAACANPTGAAGDMMYNADWRTPQYCDGTNWIYAGSPQYTANSAGFDGGNDYLLKSADFTGAADSTQVTGSFWFKRAATGVTPTIFRGNSTTTVNATNLRFLIEFTAANQLQIRANDSSPANSLYVTTTKTITDKNWHHVVFSFDLTNTSKRHIYIDGVADTPTWTMYDTAKNIDFLISATPRWSVGGDPVGNSGFKGTLADFWLNPGTYMDLSIVANRRKFRTAAGKPVFLNTDGSGPTGAAPLVFLSGAHSTWWTNKGTGGGFSKMNSVFDYPADVNSCTTMGTLTLVASDSSVANTPGRGGFFTDGTYVYGKGNTTITAYYFDGTTLATPVTTAVVDTVDAIADGKGYIFVSAHDTGNTTGYLYAYTYDGAAFTLVASITLPDIPQQGALVYDGRYIFVATGTTDATTRVRAYRFTSSVFGQMPGSLSLTNIAQSLYSDGTYLYSISPGGTSTKNIVAFTYNGTSFTQLATADRGNSRYMCGSSSSILYVSQGFSQGIIPYTFNGAAFNPGWSNIPTGANNFGLDCDGSGFIYSASGSNGLQIWESFYEDMSLITSYNTPGNTQHVLRLGKYIYIADAPNLLIVSGWNECTNCSGPNGKAGDIIYNAGTHHVLQYCDGQSWIAMGPDPGAGGGGCSNPAGAEGNMMYNNDYNMMQYCDGTDWVKMGQ